MTDYPELEEARREWRYQPPEDCLADRAVLVTGAGDGIGRTVAMTCAAFGADVILLGRTQDKLETVSDWISAHTDTDPVIVPCDLAGLGDDNAAALSQAIGDNWGRLDGIVHNASELGPKVPIAHYPTADWARVFKVNVEAPFILTRTLLPLLTEAPAASVIFTASSVGRKGRAYWGAYSASKFALEGLSQILADEHENTTGIRFNSLNPGGTRTAMRRSAYPAENPNDVPPPEVHMDLYLYLLTDASADISGSQFDARDWDYSGMSRPAAPDRE